jgi:hypothetical protein
VRCAVTTVRRTEGPITNTKLGVAKPNMTCVP